jgi:hypothetical protein
LQRLANEHVQHTIGLAMEGHLLHAGALIEQGSEPNLTGLGFSRLSPDELRPHPREGPGVIAGMESYRLMTHVFRNGGLDF